jgi:hypothetical protein
LAQRYARPEKDSRKNDWHYLIMGLTVFFVGVALYLAGFVVLSRLLPDLHPEQVAWIVGLAYIAAGGGAAGRSMGRAVRLYYDRRPERRRCRRFEVQDAVVPA